jgi:glycosyltransferase involved in cell wall biosynthesis
MNILIIHQYFLEEDDSGGSRWNEIARNWSEKGHSISVLCGMMHANGSKKRPEYKNKLFVRKNQGNIDVLRCHVSETYNKGFRGRLWGYFSFVFSSLYGGLFKLKSKPDIIVVTSPPLFVALSGYIISKLKGIPFVFEVRDLWPESAIDTGVLKNKQIIQFAFWFEKFIYKKATLINVLTPAFYEILKTKKHVPEHKLILIPNAADFSLSEDLFQTFDRELFREENDLQGKFVITYVGAHGVANHLQQIIEAGKELEDTNVLFLLIGKGMEKEHLIELAKEQNVQNVRFLESVPKKDVFKYIIASEMGISVLKKVDTFKTVYSNKTFDYMSCKKPILMAIDGVSRELVEKADAGSYIEPENKEEFSRVIRHYLNNPEILDKQGLNGYQYAKENFDRTLLSNLYLDKIQTVITKK